MDRELRHWLRAEDEADAWIAKARARARAGELGQEQAGVVEAIVAHDLPGELEPLCHALHALGPDPLARLLSDLHALAIGPRAEGSPDLGWVLDAWIVRRRDPLPTLEAWDHPDRTEVTKLDQAPGHVTLEEERILHHHVLELGKETTWVADAGYKHFHTLRLGDVRTGRGPTSEPSRYSLADDHEHEIDPRFVVACLEATLVQALLALTRGEPEAPTRSVSFVRGVENLVGEGVVSFVLKTSLLPWALEGSDGCRRRLERSEA